MKFLGVNKRFSGVEARIEAWRRSFQRNDSFQQLLFRSRIVAALVIAVLIVGLGVVGVLAHWELWAVYWLVHRFASDAMSRRAWRKGRNWSAGPYIDAFDIALFAAAVPAARPYLGITVVGVLPIVLIGSGFRTAISSSLLAIAGISFGMLFTGGAFDGALLVAVAAHLSTMPLAVGRLLKEREQTSRQLEELVDGLEAVVWQGNPQTGEVGFVSPRIFSLFGVSVESYLADPTAWIVPEDRPACQAQFAGIEPSQAVTCTYRVLDGNGDLRWVRDTVRLSHEETGLVLRGVIVDVTAQKLVELQVEHQATRDGLTGTLNRNAFLAELETVLNEEQAFALVMLDLDNFKEINDSLGHAAGDQLLCTVSDRLNESIGQRGFVGRLGGDEFAVVVFLEGADLAQDVVESLSQCLDLPIISDQLTVQTSASFGYAVSPDDGTSSERLLMLADQAMYKAKRSGAVATRAVAVTPDSGASSESDAARNELLRDLPQGIARGEFDIRLLPKIEATSGRVVGAEALVRWNHPRLGLLQPSQFMDLIESSGSIRPMTDGVLRGAVQQLEAWQSQGLPWTIAVNLCVRNLLDPSLQPVIRELLQTYAVDPGRLIIEVAEGALARDRGTALKVLGTLRELGCAISIDDFGSGATSLVDLEWLRPHEIKVDRPFVQGMGYCGSDRLIVSAATALAKAMGIRVVAEGVQNAAQLAALIELGVNEYQGYFASVPMPAEEFLDWASVWDAAQANVEVSDLSATRLYFTI